jgi:hypothetical protein
VLVYRVTTGRHTVGFKRGWFALHIGWEALFQADYAIAEGPLRDRSEAIMERGTIEGQVRNDHGGLDRDLEGARSLGATLGEGSFVFRE